MKYLMPSYARVSSSNSMLYALRPLNAKRERERKKRPRRISSLLSYHNRTHVWCTTDSQMRWRPEAAIVGGSCVGPCASMHIRGNAHSDCFASCISCREPSVLVVESFSDFATICKKIVFWPGTARAVCIANLKSHLNKLMDEFEVDI